jgi:tetratricopeptide (TPR) repeat protein
LLLGPKRALAWNNKGTALYNLGKHKEAMEYYDKALEIDPKNAMALSNKGSALYKLGKHNEAMEYFDKALEIDPKNAMALSNTGWALYKLGKHNEAYLQWYSIDSLLSILKKPEFHNVQKT